MKDAMKMSTRRGVKGTPEREPDTRARTGCRISLLPMPAVAPAMIVFTPMAWNFLRNRSRSDWNPDCGRTLTPMPDIEGYQ